MEMVTKLSDSQYNPNHVLTQKEANILDGLFKEFEAFEESLDEEATILFDDTCFRSLLEGFILGRTGSINLASFAFVGHYSADIFKYVGRNSNNESS